MSHDFKSLLLNNERLEVDLQEAENNVVIFNEKIKNQSLRHKEDINKLEQQITRAQKENCLKSHKIGFLLEKIENDCEKWNCIENDLKKEICHLNLLLTEKQQLLNERNETIDKIRYLYLRAFIWHCNYTIFFFY